MTTSFDWDKILTPVGSAVRLHVKVTPGASRTKILGPHGNCLKIAVAAAPEKGGANRALIAFLAEVLKVPRNHITLRTGQTSPQKTLHIANRTPEQCRRLLQPDHPAD